MRPCQAMVRVWAAEFPTKKEKQASLKMGGRGKKFKIIQFSCVNHHLQKCPSR